MSNEVRGAVVQIGIEQTGEGLRGVAGLYCCEHALGGEQLHAREQGRCGEDHLLGAIDGGEYGRGGFA